MSFNKINLSSFVTEAATDLYVPCLVLHPELLMASCPLVERLGFDENFVDITEMVEKRLKETPESSSCSFQGHVYNHLSESLWFSACIWLVETGKWVVKQAKRLKL